MDDRPLRTLDIVRWAIVCIFTLAGIALFYDDYPPAVILFILGGYGLSLLLVLSLFGLPLDHPVIRWLNREW